MIKRFQKDANLNGFKKENDSECWNEFSPLFYSIAGMNRINLIIISFRTNYHVVGAFWLLPGGFFFTRTLLKNWQYGRVVWLNLGVLLFFFLNLRMILGGHHRGTDGLLDKNRQNSIPAWVLVKRHGKSSSKLVFSNDQLLSIYMIKSFKINNSWIYVQYKS